MQKSLILFVLSLFLGCHSVPKTELQKKFPLEMQTDDYGILTEADVKFYADESDPLPIEKETGNHGFWICVEKKDITIKCNDFGPSDWKPVEHNGEPEIHLKYGGKRHFYIWNRGIDIKSCRAHAQSWAESIKNAEHVCVAGYRIDNQKLPSGETEYSWIFDQIKTKTWCDSRFIGRCENLQPDEYDKREEQREKKRKRKL